MGDNSRSNLVDFESTVPTRRDERPSDSQKHSTDKDETMRSRLSRNVKIDNDVR